MNKLKILDLFSGIGGFSLGLERTGHFKTVAFCDNDKFSNLVLQKHWKGVKIYNNVKEITKERLEADGIESPDIITGGFPCQPFSVAGKQKGTSDDRHLWPEMFRIIKAFKPRFVIGENVRGLINIQNGMVFETVCTDLESEGYEVQPFIIPASGVGAPHRRERVWIIAIREESMVNSNNIRFEQHNETEEEASRRRSSATFEPTSDVAYTENGRRQQTQSERWQGTERGSIDSRGIEGERKDIGSNVENSNNNGLERGFTETRNEASTRKESSINGIKNTDLSSRRSDGGGNQSQPKINGIVQGLRDGNEKESTEATRVRGLYERTNISEGATRENRNYENDSGALVSKRQTRIQSSVSGGLESNQTASKNNQIRQRDDNSSLNRMERRNENVENSRRTLRQRSELFDTNEDEVGEGYANQLERSSRSSESNVADTTESRSFSESIGDIGGVGEESSRKEEGRNQSSVCTSTRSTEKSTDVADTDINTKTQRGEYTNAEKESNERRNNERGGTSNVGERCVRETGKGSSEKLANTDSERLEGQRQSSRELYKTFFATDSSEERQRQMDQGWWSFEPNVGRVAHGVSGRVHRLKGLGNAIVPQIAEEIGKAIINAIRKK